MMKARWGSNAKALREQQLAYIAGGKNKRLANGELVYPAKSIKDGASHKSYLAKHKYFLEPKGKGRRSKTTDLRLIMSFQGAVSKDAHKIAIEFLKEYFPGMYAAYATHSKPVKKNAAGDKQAGWHIHFVICPRKPDGKMLRLRKQDLKTLKAAYHELTVRYRLATGWKSEPEPSANPPNSLTPTPLKRI